MTSEATTRTNFVSQSSRLARCCRQDRIFLRAQVTALLFWPHLISFLILYSSYVICLFFYLLHLFNFFFSLTMISFNHIHLFFSFLKVNLLFFNSFCFFSLSPAVVILYRESFLMYSFFFLSLSTRTKQQWPPPPLTRTPYPFKSHRNLSSRWAAEGNIKRVMSGL